MPRSPPCSGSATGSAAPGWVALSFAILGGLSLALKIDPTLVTNQNVAKGLIALLLVMPYCLFRFAATFRSPSRPVRTLAIVLTAAIVLFTFTLRYLPAPGFPPPPHFLAYRISFLVSFGFLFGYVVVSLFLAGRGEPPIASSRMHLLAVAVAGLEIQVRGRCTRTARSRRSTSSRRRSPWRWASSS